MLVSELITKLQNEDPDAEVIKHERGSYVATWITVQEPQVIIMVASQSNENTFHELPNTNDDRPAIMAVEI